MQDTFARARATIGYLVYKLGADTLLLVCDIAEFYLGKTYSECVTAEFYLSKYRYGK